MYRFVLRPRWLASHLLAVALVVVFVNLGFWQLGRHDDKIERNETIATRTGQDPAALRALLDETDDPSALRYRSAVVTGTYVTGHDILVDNRSNDGLPGAWVVTPLRLDDGSLVAVSRGFQGFDSGLIEPPPPPAGEVRVEGTVLNWDDGDCGVRTDDGGTPVGAACLNRSAVESAAGAPVGPVALQRTRSAPADAEVLVPVPLPELDAGPHRSYAAQWFIFAAIGTIGYPLILRRVAKDKAAEAHGVADPDVVGDLDAELADLIAQRDAGSTS